MCVFIRLLIWGPGSLAFVHNAAHSGLFCRKEQDILLAYGNSRILYGWLANELMERAGSLLGHMIPGLYCALQSTILGDNVTERDVNSYKHALSSIFYL